MKKPPRSPSSTIYMTKQEQAYLAEQSKARRISRAALVRMSLRYFCAAYPVEGGQDKAA